MRRLVARSYLACRSTATHRRHPHHGWLGRSNHRLQSRNNDVPRTALCTRQFGHRLAIRPALHPLGRERRPSQSMGHADRPILAGIDHCERVRLASRVQGRSRGRPMSARRRNVFIGVHQFQARRPEGQVDSQSQCRPAAMRRRCTGGGGVGVWVHVLRFLLLYRVSYPVYLVTCCVAHISLLSDR